MVLLTGATGFLGGYLAEALAKQGKPWAVLLRETSDRSGLQQLATPPDFREGDLLEQPVYGHYLPHLWGV